MTAIAYPSNYFEIEKHSAGISVWVWIVYKDNSRLAYFWDPQSAVEFIDSRVEV